jgi:DNA-binding transcriptional regulator YdaS (Cro superfamily)
VRSPSTSSNKRRLTYRKAALYHARMNYVEKACKEAGGQSTVARKFGVTVQAISQWVSSQRVPANRVLELEQACGGKVTRHQLRPDIFGESAPAAPESTVAA